MSCHRPSLPLTLQSWTIRSDTALSSIFLYHSCSRLGLGIFWSGGWQWKIQSSPSLGGHAQICPVVYLTTQIEGIFKRKIYPLQKECYKVESVQKPMIFFFFKQDNTKCTIQQQTKFNPQHLQRSHIALFFLEANPGPKNPKSAFENQTKATMQRTWIHYNKRAKQDAKHQEE